MPAASRIEHAECMHLKGEKKKEYDDGADPNATNAMNAKKSVWWPFGESINQSSGNN